jgi:hypothetical protein
LFRHRSVHGRRIGRRRASRDPEVFLTPEDLAQAREFLIRLLPLNRPYFDAALRAIRRVVEATYLVSDDPTMAYTMFVAALESLSQLVEFPDDHDWSRYDSKKAKIIDAALDGLTDEQADPIRDAVLTIDQLSLRRRFTAFTLDHVRPSFYREEAVNARQPIRAVDLPKALDFAYQLRSKNVHALQTLAPELWVVADRAETLPVNKIRALGLEGLNRLTRHVIRTFVDRAPTHLDESFQYRDHLPNIVRMRFAPEMWIGRPDAMSRDTRTGGSSSGADLRKPSGYVHGIRRSAREDSTTSDVRYPSRMIVLSPVTGAFHPAGPAVRV